MTDKFLISDADLAEELGFDMDIFSSSSSQTEFKHVDKNENQILSDLMVNGESQIVDNDHCKSVVASSSLPDILLSSHLDASSSSLCNISSAFSDKASSFAETSSDSFLEKCVSSTILNPSESCYD